MNDDEANYEVARRWCQSQGNNWAIVDQAGRGSTAPVFNVSDGKSEYALKIFDKQYSEGEQGDIEERRVAQQLNIKNHGCPYLVETFDGGRFEDRLFLLMSKAPGLELEKKLKDVPREKIRSIIGQIAEACLSLRSIGLCHRDIKSANIFISDDFSHATLLDLSVVREIHDPVGIGTDQNGQLPVVATSRYCSPEYLFRLLDPCPALWHALDVYQLGGLIHDLVMREPLFHADYISSAKNRYRFAWIVATKTPIVEASDVDQDLILLSRRSLDKDWKRRSEIKIEDFLNSTESHRAQGLSLLGLTPKKTPMQPVRSAAAKHLRITQLSEAIKNALQIKFLENGIKVLHEINAGLNDVSKIISLRWNSPEGAIKNIHLKARVSLAEDGNNEIITTSLTLSAQVNGFNEEVSMNLPHTEFIESASSEISNLIFTSFGDLGSNLMKIENRKDAV